MRLLLAAILATCGVTVLAAPAQAIPADCPPACDRIPDSAWIASTAIPLYSQYRWPGLAGLAVTAPNPRFRFEEDCRTPRLPGDERSFAVAARAVVPHPAGQWNLQVQVLHWRGDVAAGGESALRAVRTAAATLRACQITAPATSPSVTTDQPDRLAAVLSVGGERVLHQYLIAHPRSSSVVEVALWSSVPPLVGWPPVADSALFDAMVTPLCRAYIGSCR